MKKALIILMAAITAAAFASCGEPDSSQSETDVTIQITSKSVKEATTESVKINEETVSIAKKKSSAPTDPTSPTEKSSKSNKKKRQQKLKEKQKKKMEKVPTQGETKAGTYVAVTTAPDGSFSDSDLTFIFEGAYIELGDDIEDVEAILGDDNSVIELSKARTAYEYDDLTVITVTRGDDETAEKITVLSDKIETKKGAKVGMYATQLRTVYGEPSKKTAKTYTYTSGDKSLVFEYENNIVTSYSYILAH